MSISESQLDTWSKQGSVAQSRDTYGTIKGALEDATAPYAGKSYSIFLQGSYGNDTNIYADSDVDVVMRLASTFYHDLDDLSEDQKNAFHKVHAIAEYRLQEFKRDVITQLTRKYGSSVKPGSKAVFIEASGSRRNADVIVTAQYRRYKSFLDTNNQSYIEGICFYASNGNLVANFPKQHSANCTLKHQGTNSRFKPTVRIFKNMRNRMIDKKMIEEGLAPFLLPGRHALQCADREVRRQLQFNRGGVYKLAFGDGSDAASMRQRAILPASGWHAGDVDGSQLCKILDVGVRALATMVKARSSVFPPHWRPTRRCRALRVNGYASRRDEIAPHVVEPQSRSAQSSDYLRSLD